METVTLFKDTYETLMDSEFAKMTELAEIKGKLSALATMEDHPEFVFKYLKEMVDNFDS